MMVQLNDIKYTYVEHKELPNKELLALEKEMLGIYISGHPLQKLREQIEKQTNINTMELRKIDNQMNSNMNEEKNKADNNELNEEDLEQVQGGLMRKPYVPDNSDENSTVNPAEARGPAIKFF